MASHARAPFRFVIPGLRVFLLGPCLLRRGLSFWPALRAGHALTVALFAMTAALLAKAERT
jgi:hypothetical protein